MHKERGQSLVLGTLFLATIVMSVLYLFNVSQQNLNKTKLQNTADATVISGAQLLARDLNFKAYTNRAMVANHVAVAQYVGLSSWGNMADKTGENLRAAFAAVPGLGQVAAGVSSVLRVMNQIIQPSMYGAVFATDVVNRALSVSQDLMNAATMAALVDTTNKVLKANDKDAYVDFASTVNLADFILYDWRNFQGRFNRTDRTGRYQEHFNLVTNSVDPFTDNRSFNWGAPFSFKIPYVFKVTVKQAGGTDLYKNGFQSEVWSGMDTLGFHIHKYRCSWKGCRWKGGELPTGWGASHAGSNKSTRYFTNRNDHGKSRSINGKSSKFAFRNETGINSVYSGLQSFYDIKKTEKVNVAPMLTLAISKDKSDITTSSSLEIGTKNQNGTRQVDINIEEDTQLPRDKMTVLSKAKVYYFRDKTLWGTSNSKWEYGNLYNPYWQTTLNDTSNNERRVFSALALVL